MDLRRRASTELYARRRMLGAAVEELERNGAEVTDRVLALHILELLALPYQQEGRRRHPSAHSSHEPARPENGATLAFGDESGRPDNVVPLQPVRNHRDQPGA